MRNILVVEDEKMIRKGICVMIQNSDIPYQMVQECRNGKEAIQLLEGKKYDLVITDVRMPFIGGIELVKWIKENIEEENRPNIIVVSGYAEFEYVREVMKNGAVDYILKPVDKEELLQVCWKVEEHYVKQLKEKGLYVQTAADNSNSSFVNQKKIQDAVEFIFRNYRRDIDMVEVSNYVSMNYTMFSVEFKKYTHQNFPSFLKKLRIEKAKQYIRQSDLKINELCQKIGYNDPKRFAKVFKEVTGMTPKAYRDSLMK